MEVLLLSNYLHPKAASMFSLCSRIRIICWLASSLAVLPSATFGFMPSYRSLSVFGGDYTTSTVRRINFELNVNIREIFSTSDFEIPFLKITGKNDIEMEKRKALKDELIALCSNGNNNLDRSEVERIINALAKLSPVQETAKSALLEKEWKMVWTTEKEINLFKDKGWSSDIRQTIKDGVLSNSIFFEKGGGLFVNGKLSPAASEANEMKKEPNLQRTNFEFVSAMLDLSGILGQWAKFKIPPVGKGWFDTIYLDENLRVDVNIRNDILVCVPKS